MKKVYLFSILFVIAIFLCYLYSQKASYASGSAGDSVRSGGFYQTAFSGTDKPRDFKLPDTYRDEDPASGQASARKSWKGPKLVVIDPGHGGMDPGANINGLTEKDISLDISLKADAMLRSAGISTYLTRNDDTFIDLKERIYTANDKNAALFVSIHSNWIEDASSNGTMTLYHPSASLSAGYLDEPDFARIMQDELMKVLGTKNRGIVPRPDLAVLRHANMPSIIVELGFLSHAGDARLLASQEFRQKAAEALVEGIKKSLLKISVK